MTATELMIPSIHSNGTSASRLIKGLEDAYYKVGAALDSLRECGPNGRDYYVQDPSALGKAIEQHVARMKKLHDVQGEIGNILVGIHDQKLRERSL